MSISLSNSLLELEIQEAGQKYKGSRFDWTGQITQIKYKEMHSFCTNETLKPEKLNELGRGLYNEFGIDDPIGYNECALGDKYPKIGIGMLTRDSDKPYVFYKPHEVLPANFNHDSTKDSVSFISDCKEINGYGFKLLKKITLKDDTFSIKYKLFNTGTKEISTSEYVHNFLSINNRKIDNSYQLKFSAPLKQNGEIVNPEEKVKFSDNRINWVSEVGKEFFFSEILPFKEGITSWQLENLNDKVGIKESCSFNPLRVNLWGSTHVVSPEIFFKLKVAPGKSISWQRNYIVYEF